MTGWTEEGLIRAWKALAAPLPEAAWRFVRLASVGPVTVEAGCRFPLGQEALIVVFPGPVAVDAGRLPEGKGFDVARISGEQQFAGRTAIALVRRAEGAPDIFAAVAIDILRALGASSGADVLDAFLQRVRDWQAFMARKHRPLGPEAQVGLMGELWLLDRLAGPLGADAFGTWQGPLKAAQDFHLEGGAIEVKSTARRGPFLAKINSIGQLDSPREPLFLLALRHVEAADGATLPDLVSALRSRFEAFGCRLAFDARLMVMGYLDEHAPLYGRRLAVADLRAFRVEGDLPRLTRDALPAAIRDATYTLDLDALGMPALGLPDLLHAFGLD